jgi:preprotein translocase subunit SecD
LTGRYITTAQVDYDSQTGRPQIGITFNSEGSDLFAKITKENIGTQLAIVLDGQIISAPTIQTEIIGGKAQITGQFSVQEANNLARSLKYGALPVAIELVGTQTIGASLGADALKASMKAGLYGFAIVALFLMLWYRVRGFVAGVALIIYTIINLLVFKTFGIVLTSAGLAAFIISIGMAVDGNILIFERMREELYAGKTLKAAIDQGFAKAWSAIIDSNLTNILATIPLLVWGSGPVRGFAVTLLVGAVITLFTAVVVTRAMFTLIAASGATTFNIGQKRTA